MLEICSGTANLWPEAAAAPNLMLEKCIYGGGAKKEEKVVVFQSHASLRIPTVVSMHYFAVFYYGHPPMRTTKNS